MHVVCYNLNAEKLFTTPSFNGFLDKSICFTLFEKEIRASYQLFPCYVYSDAHVFAMDMSMEMSWSPKVKMVVKNKLLAEQKLAFFAYAQHLQRLSVWIWYPCNYFWNIFPVKRCSWAAVRDQLVRTHSKKVRVHGLCYFLEGTKNRQKIKIGFLSHSKTDWTGLVGEVVPCWCESLEYTISS